MDNLIQNYKEILVNKSEKKHTYFFKYDNKDDQMLLLSVKGHYIIDEFGNKWMSVDAISSIFPEKYYELLHSKYYDVNNSEQKLFYLLPTITPEPKNEYGKIIMNTIKSNVRQGSPRKFITLPNGEKVNIEMPIDTISNFKFK